MPAGRRRCPRHSGKGSRPMAGCTYHVGCRGSMRGASTRGHRSRRWPVPCSRRSSKATGSSQHFRRSRPSPSTSLRRSYPSRTARNDCPSSSCSMARRRLSRISGRVSSPPALRACASRVRRRSLFWWRPPATRAPPWRRPSTGDPACASWSCIPKGACRRSRSSSSRAGTATCAASRSREASTIASGS